MIKTLKTIQMNEVQTRKTKLKTSILFLTVCLLAIKGRTQTMASTPEQCVQQYMAWKNDPMGIKPENLFHLKVELHWLEQDQWYKKNGWDYIQKIQAGNFIDRRQKFLSIHKEKKVALAKFQEVFPAEKLVASETLKLEKRKGYWQITEILITYQSTEEFTSKTSSSQNSGFTQN